MKVKASAKTKPTNAAAYLTPKEAAAILRIDRETLYGLLRAGEIKGAVKFGDSWRIPRKSILPSE